MRLHVSRIGVTVLAGLTLCLLMLSLPVVTQPALRAQSTGEFRNPGLLSPRDRLLHVMSLSPDMARLIEHFGLLERAPTWSRAEMMQANQPAPESDPARTIDLTRYIQALCFVKAKSFSSQKVIWPAYNNYEGDCIFFVYYTAYYSGGAAMDWTKTIKDQWKKGMSLGVPPDITKPYYLLAISGYDPYGTCPSEYGEYDPSTGVFTTTIGATTASPWLCGAYAILISKNGADLTMFSPKPGVSHSFIDLTTNKKTTEQIAGTPYEMKVEVKSFAVKSPASKKCSGWDYLDLDVYASSSHVKGDTGMWVTHADPPWYDSMYTGPPGPSDGEVRWNYRNPVWELDDPDMAAAYPAPNPKLIVQTSSMSVTYVKNDAPVVTGTPLYTVWLYLGYYDKGLSFVTGDDISFSGNPSDIRADRSLYWDNYLYAEYPDITTAT